MSASPWYPAILAALSVAALLWSFFWPVKGLSQQNAEELSDNNMEAQASQNNTFVGAVHPRLAAGSGNTVVNFADQHGNTIIDRGGLAIGSGAYADSTSIAIGAGAMAGHPAVVPEPPRAIQAMSGADLRIYAFDLIQRIRALGDRQRAAENDLHPVSDESILKTWNRLQSDYQQEFNQRFGLRARELLRELRERTGATTRDGWSTLLDSNHMGGPAQIEEVAVLLERLTGDIY